MNYLKHKDINKQRWDQTIEKSTHGVPYCLSWYLDTISPQWDALIDSDYETVMPVTVKKKFGFSYVIQPLFAQQLGIIALNDLNSHQIMNFCHELSSRFRYIMIQLNAHNCCDMFNTLLPNYILPLSKNYEELRNNFTENHKRNIRKLINIGSHKELFIANSQIVEGFIRKNEKLTSIVPLFLSLSNEIITRGMGKWQIALNKDDQIESIIFWLIFKQRHYYLYSLSSLEGKENRASFFLINEYIKRHAGSNAIIDFEGSKIPGIARFFKGFGAIPEYYPLYKFNNMVWPFRRL
jgi:hypothetical protein